ncbi:MAG: MMPL family transporter [Treponema sp.]|jgi:predicted RND superfamily exporter protein|nr:MMPL family transporter [Treponema sp.]
MRKLYKNPWLIVAVIALITLFFVLQFPRVELDNNNLRFVPADDPALETSRWIDDTFGSSFFILVGLERQYGTVFNKEFLNRLRDYVDQVKDISIVKDAVSLLTTDYITASGDSIVVERLVTDDFSGSDAEIAELKRRILSWDMYEHSLVSDDFSSTQILVPLTISNEEAGSSKITAQCMQVRDLARQMFAGLATVYVTGMPIISATINEAVNNDLLLLVPLVVLVVLVVLFFSFRGFTAVVLPLLTVLIAVIWSVGAMPLFGVRLSVISTVLPVILVAVGSAYGIHVVTHYGEGRRSRKSAGEMGRGEHGEFVLEVMLKIRKPVFLAALTTFVAFFSFCFTRVAPIREFGYFSSFGVVAAFAVAVTLIPALLIIRGPRPFRGGPAQSADKDRLSAAIAGGLVAIAARKKTVIFCTLIATAVALYGFSKMVIDNIMIEYFKAKTDIYQSDRFIRRQFGGSKVISVVLQAESPEILLRPEVLSAMDGLAGYLQNRVSNVGKVMGFTDLIKRINQVFNADESPEGLKASAAASGGGDFGFGFGNDAEPDFGFGPAPGGVFDEAAAVDSGGNPQREKVFTQNDLLDLFDRASGQTRNMSASELVRELKRQVNYGGASYYEIPVDPKRYGKESPEDLQRLVSNYLVLLSGSISDYANDPLEPTAIKATVQLRTVGQHDSEAIFDEIRKYAAANFPPAVTVTIGGTTMVESSLNDLVVQSQLISVLISIICVFIIITVSNRSFIAGLIGIAPLSISVLINFAVMGFAGIRLNLGTSMVASVSVGVGIDYTIHYLEAYKREYRALGGAGGFLYRTFASSGKAILINAVSVGAGFAVLLFSSFNMLADLGLLIAITMGSSALVSLTVLPALLSICKPRFIRAPFDEAVNQPSVQIVD